MHHGSGASTSTSSARKSMSAARRTASLAEVLEAVARESKVAIVSLEKERTELEVSTTAGMLQQPPSTSRGKNDLTAKTGLAPRTGPASSVSVLLLCTVSVVTAGFVISAVAAGSYISSGGALGSWRLGNGSVRNAAHSRNLLAPAPAPAVATGGTGEELEAEEMARRHMIRPDDPASSEGGAVESGPPTEPFKDVDGADAKVPALNVRKASARTSSQPASEPRTDDGTPPTASSYADSLHSAPNRTRAPAVSD